MADTIPDDLMLQSLRRTLLDQERFWKILIVLHRPAHRRSIQPRSPQSAQGGDRPSGLPAAQSGAVQRRSVSALVPLFLHLSLGVPRFGLPPPVGSVGDLPYPHLDLPHPFCLGGGRRSAFEWGAAGAVLSGHQVNFRAGQGSCR